VSRSSEVEVLYWRLYRKACRNARKDGSRHLTEQHLREVGLPLTSDRIDAMLSVRSRQS